MTDIFQRIILLTWLGWLAVSDAKNCRIEKRITFLGLLALILCMILNDNQTVWIRVMGLIPGLVMLWGGKIAPKMIGLGDGYCLVGIGLALGIEKTVLTLGISLALLFLWGMALIITKHANWKTRIPFIPILFIGTILALYKT